MGKSLPEREFRIENRGGGVLDVAHVEAEGGFVVEPAAEARGFCLPSQESRTLRVRRATEASRQGHLRALDARGEVLAEARVEWLLPGRPIAPPFAFVIGIDFGTSNTSVIARDVRARANPPVPLPDEEHQRFETLVYVKGSRDADWAIGEEALNRADQDPSGTLIPNLKTLVRENPDAVVMRVLTYYLERLLRKIVEPYLERVNPGNLPVCFVFSLPVLDKGAPEPAAHERYRKAVLDAAEGAGYLDTRRSWSLDTILEPDAAALEILLSEPGKQPFSDDDLILVIDGGGGTTDLTLATVAIVEGEVGLKDVRNASVVVAENDVNRDQFGGNRVDDELFSLLTVGNSQFRQEWAVDNDRDKEGDVQLDRDFRARAIRLIKGRKEAIAGTGADRQRVYQSDKSRREYWLTLDQVERVFEDYKTQVLGSIDDFLRAQRVERRNIRSVFAVGGNNRLETLPRILRDHFGRDRVVLLEPHRRSVAVPRGIVYRFSNRVQALTVDVELTSPEWKAPVELSGRSVGGDARRAVLPVVAGDRTYIDVWALLPGGERRAIERLPVVCDESAELAQVAASIREGELRVVIDGTGIRPVDFSFRLEPTR